MKLENCGTVETQRSLLGTLTVIRQTNVEILLGNGFLFRKIQFQEAKHYSIYHGRCEEKRAARILIMLAQN